MQFDVTVYIYHLKKFSLNSFLLSATASCCRSLPLSISFGAGLVSIHVYGSSKVSGSVALWTSVLALCLHLSVCLWVPVYLLDLPFWFWFPGPLVAVLSLLGCSMVQASCHCLLSQWLQCNVGGFSIVMSLF